MAAVSSTSSASTSATPGYQSGDQSGYQSGAVASSSTPYTDLIKSKKRTNHVKRPLNPFMLWAQQEREKMCKGKEGQQQTNISSVLGKKWNKLGEDEKEPWRIKAAKAKVLHKLQYPDYQYKPRRKAKRNTVKYLELIIHTDQKNGPTSPATPPPSVSPAFLAMPASPALTALTAAATPPASAASTPPSVSPASSTPPLSSLPSLFNNFKTITEANDIELVKLDDDSSFCAINIDDVDTVQGLLTGDRVVLDTSGGQ